MKYIEHDVSADRAAASDMVRKSGQMGVPVVIADGEVIVGFDRIRLERLLSKGNGGHRLHFGISVADAARIAHRSGHIPVMGAYIGKIAPNSLGEKANLKPGDIITEVNSIPIRNADDLEKALSTLTAGCRVEIALLRDQKPLILEISI